MNLDDEGLIICDKSVKLKPYQPRELMPFETLGDQELMTNAGGDLIVDCEFYPNYFLIAFKCIRTNKCVLFEQNNFDSRKLAWIMHNYRTIGFNSIKFDIPLIWLAHNCPLPQILKDGATLLIVHEQSIKELQATYNFKIQPTKHIDLIEVCPLMGSLKLYGARLHSKRIQELPFHHEQNLTEIEMEQVKHYCCNDLSVTELIFNNLRDQLVLREQLSTEYKQDLMSKSDAQIAEAVICGELKRLTGYWPRKPKQQAGNVHSYTPPAFISFQTEKLQKLLEKIKAAKYQVLENGRVVVPEEIANVGVSIGNSTYRLGNGGLHSSEKQQAIKSNSDYILIDRDVASYYPTIILNCGLFPTHLGENFLTVYRALVERRLAAKAAKNSAVAEALKITINGTFGKLGSPYSTLYAPDLMIQVTVTGQLALLMLIEEIELRNIEVVSANTDGIIIKCPKYAKEYLNQIIQRWEQQTKFVTEETEYSALYSRDVNAYLAIKKDGSSKGKNIFYDPWNSKDVKDLIWRFHKNPNAQICTEAVIQHITKGEPIDQTIRRNRDITRFVCVKNVTGGAHKDGNYLGKTIRWYYSTEIHGTINYVKTNNKVPDSEFGRPVMDLPDEFPDDIRYESYIDKANEMLEDLAFTTKNKQMVFF